MMPHPQKLASIAKNDSSFVFSFVTVFIVLKGHAL